MDEDPREYRSVTSRLVLELLIAQARAGAMAGKMRTPVLFLVAGEDRIVDSAESRKVFDGLKIEDKAYFEFPGMYHALSIDVGKEAVFEKLLKWALNRVK
jgi:alpha-beta hydrolase superfamily lysophospholipase